VNFRALKALRNLFHHEVELLSRVKIVSSGQLPITTDLLFLCLIERKLALEAVEQDFAATPRQSGAHSQEADNSIIENHATGGAR